MNVTDKPKGVENQDTGVEEKKYDRLERRIEAVLREQGVEREKIIEILANQYVNRKTPTLPSKKLKLEAIKLIMKIDPSYTVPQKKLIISANVELTPKQMSEYEERVKQVERGRP